MTAGINELSEDAEWYICEFVGLVAREDDGDMFDTGVGRAGTGAGEERSVTDRLCWATDELRER